MTNEGSKLIRERRRWWIKGE